MEIKPHMYICTLYRYSRIVTGHELWSANYYHNSRSTIQTVYSISDCFKCLLLKLMSDTNVSTYIMYWTKIVKGVTCVQFTRVIITTCMPYIDMFYISSLSRWF